MGHYKSNLRDIEFVLFDVLGTGERLGQGPFAEIDEDTARGILDEVRRLAEGPLADSFAEGDRTPPVFDPATNSVVMPRRFQEVLRRPRGGRVVAPEPARGARRHASRRGRCTGPPWRWCSAPTRPCTCTTAARRSPP